MKDAELQPGSRLLVSVTFILARREMFGRGNGTVHRASLRPKPCCVPALVSDVQCKFLHQLLFSHHVIDKFEASCNGFPDLS